VTGGIGSPRATRDVALLHVEALTRIGLELQQPSVDPARGASADEIRAWQQQCAAAVTHLSGGSKAHWLSRAFSDALLVRSADGTAVVEAPAADIVRRILDVLARARASLLQMDDEGAVAALTSDAPPQRFAFVHRRELQPVLERAYADSRAALDREDHAAALVLACGILESIVTDALDHAAAPASPVADGRVSSRVAEMSFDARITAAEEAGLIGRGCSRLPVAARRYRDLLDDAGSLSANANVSARDAQIAAQVLKVVIRNLDPGR
jgi:hypothetical protein